MDAQLVIRIPEEPLKQIVVNRDQALLTKLETIMTALYDQLNAKLDSLDAKVTADLASLKAQQDANVQKLSLIHI